MQQPAINYAIASGAMNWSMFEALVLRERTTPSQAPAPSSQCCGHAAAASPAGDSTQCTPANLNLLQRLVKMTVRQDLREFEATLAALMQEILPATAIRFGRIRASATDGDGKEVVYSSGSFAGAVQEGNVAAVVIERGDRNLSAYPPDLPECITTGRTVEEIEPNFFG